MIFKRMFDFVWKLQTVTLYCLLIMFIGRHSFATNIGLIKVVNYNLEKLNPLRKYTTIKLDIPKQTIPRPKKRRPLKKYEKKRKVPTSGKNGFHKPVVIGRTDVELGRKSKRNDKRPKQKATATPPTIKFNHIITSVITVTCCANFDPFLDCCDEFHPDYCICDDITEQNFETCSKILI